MGRKLFRKFNRELSEEEIKKIERTCHLCGKQHLITCGTAVVEWSGCCVGIETPKAKTMLRRWASIPCFLKKLTKDGIITLTEKGKEMMGD